MNVAKEQPAKKILMLIDWENLITNMDLPPAERYSNIEGFDRIIKRISRDVGEIVNVFVFLSPHLAYSVSEDMYKLGFFTIVCPKIRTKEEEQQDTADGIIIDFGKKMINQISGLTHLCLGSGDKDFTPLIREATRKGLKIIILAGNKRSLSRELSKLADTRENDENEKLIYLLSPQSQE